MRHCEVLDCQNKHFARGWCRRHHARWKRHGDPLGGGPTIYASPEEAFAARTEWDGNGCLVWTGGRNKHGYGSMRVGGKDIGTHRWSYEQVHGTIPEGLFIDHECFNRACVNPNHLREATPGQNMQNRTGAQTNSASGIRGVTWHKRSQSWRGVVQHKYIQHSAGHHATKELAEDAVIKLRLKLFTHSQD